jgi:glutathionylspermidine synthase
MSFYHKKTQGNQSLQDDVRQSERGTFTNPDGGRSLFIYWNVWNSTLATRNWTRLSILRNPSWTGSANNGDPVIKHRNWSSEISTGYTCWLVSWKMMEFVKRIIPNIWKKVPNHHPACNNIFQTTFSLGRLLEGSWGYPLASVQI